MDSTLPKSPKRYYVFLVAACFFFYLMTICIKMVYSAELVSIISAFSTDKADAGLGLTAYYLVYTVSQILLALYIKDKDPFIFIIVTSILSALSFGLAAFTTEMWQIWLILGVNGFFQAGAWGGIMYFVGKYLPDSWSSAVSVIMSFGFAAGTAIAYGFSALFVALLDWRFTFLFFALLLFLSLLLFSLSVRVVHEKVGAAPKGSAALPETPIKRTLTDEMNQKTVKNLFVFLFLLNFFICCLYYGITNWVPSLLKEVHGVSESYSMLITMLLPVGMLFGPPLVNHLSEKTGLFFLVCTGSVGIGSLLLFGLIFAFDTTLLPVIILSVLSLFFIRAIVNILGGYLPLKMKHRIPSAKSSLFLNAAASFGAAISPYLTGLLMDLFGWQMLYIVLFALSAVLTVLFLFPAIKQGKRRLF